VAAIHRFQTTLTGILIVSMIPLYMLSLSSKGKVKMTEMLHLRGDDVPTVDIFIPCCGEPMNVLLDTLRATLALDYPDGKLRIVVLDDWDSTEVESQVLGLRKANVYYTARKVEVKTHSKAANLNHGLHFATGIPGGPSELIAVLDVDMIPLPHWLRALIPSILRDDKVAMANPPQLFYDMPDGDPLGQSMSFIYDSIAPMQEAMNSSWCTGSGWVARRLAIDEIGGIPTDSVQEDIWTSVFLDAREWKVAYVRRTLQWGLIGDTFAAHIKMFKRWAVGISTLARLLTHPKTLNMTSNMRISVISISFSFGVTIVATTLVMAVVPCLLFSGKPLIIYATPQQLSTLLRFGFLQFLATWIYGLVDATATDFHKPIWPVNAQMYLAPYQVMTLFHLVSRDTTPTGRMEAGERERKARISGTMAQRLWILLWEQGAIMLLAIMAACVIGAYVSFHAAVVAAGGFKSYVSLPDLGKEIGIRVAWPPAFVLWTAITVSCWKPIAYVISAPAIRSRESLLERDPVTQVAYPIAAADPRNSSERIRISQHFAVFALGYFVFAVLVSWL
jgi:cellulose synthase/poly-beta-1,6-N-acetylglucosamine synthase-like glycosyltransferase